MFISDFLDSQMRNHLVNHAHSSTKETLIFDEGSLELMIPQHHTESHNIEPASPLHSLEDIMKHSISSYHIGEESADLSHHYYIVDSYHQNGKFSVPVGDIKNTTLEKSNLKEEGLKRQNSAVPFIVRLCGSP